MSGTIDTASRVALSRAYALADAPPLASDAPAVALELILKVEASAPGPVRALADGHVDVRM